LEKLILNPSSTTLRTFQHPYFEGILAISAEETQPNQSFEPKIQLSSNPHVDPTAKLNPEAGLDQTSPVFPRSNLTFFGSFQTQFRSILSVYGQSTKIADSKKSFKRMPFKCKISPFWQLEN